MIEIHDGYDAVVNSEEENQNENYVAISSSKEDSDKKERAAAAFILDVKEKFKLTQTATQGVIDGTTNLMQV